ncbi:MAG TPA: universal stress protein, partial [Treponemataceae bacterium]|nr:universal stress protein [Treponemataceae bacterium]
IFVKEEYDEFSESLEADGKRYLQYVQELGKAKGVAIETELRSGSVWSEVITYANEIEADVILLGGTTTSDPYQRDMFNSSYGEILLHSNCSVLYVKEEYIDQLYKLL